MTAMSWVNSSWVGLSYNVGNSPGFLLTSSEDPDIGCSGTSLTFWASTTASGLFSALLSIFTTCNWWTKKNLHLHETFYIYAIGCIYNVGSGSSGHLAFFYYAKRCKFDPRMGHCVINKLLFFVSVLYISVKCPVAHDVILTVGVILNKKYFSFLPIPTSKQTTIQQNL